MRVFRVWVTGFHCSKLSLSFVNGFLNVEFKVCFVNLLTWYACCSSSISKQILTIISWYTILVRAWICSCKRKVKTIQKSLLHSGKRNDDYTMVAQTTLYCSNTQNAEQLYWTGWQKKQPTHLSGQLHWTAWKLCCVLTSIFPGPQTARIKNFVAFYGSVWAM